MLPLFESNGGVNHLPLSHQLAGVREKQWSPRELWEAHRREDDPYRAFVSRVDDFVEPAPGPLHGAMLTIKDSLNIAGLPTVCGSRYRLSAPRPAKDAACVAKLKAAGATILGKTNCPEFLANYETDNAITGWTANPWDRTRSAGGSSGGEAAAIAAGLSAGGVGSDGGGSIRLPAHFCGIAGLKPTPGRVSAVGHVPEIAHPGGLLGVVGPMARSVNDVRLLFEVLAGYDPADPFSVPFEPRPVDLRGLRIGVIESFPMCPETATALRQAADLLGGTEVFSFSGFVSSSACWNFFFNVLTDPFKREIIATDPELVHWTGLELLQDPPAEPTGVEVVKQFAIRDKLRAALLRQMVDTPVLLAPCCAVPAFRRRERNWNGIGLLDAMSCLTPFNLFGMPALSVPFALSSEGLPIGVQLIGRPYSEELLLAVGEQLEELRGLDLCELS
jgi:amidase